MSLFPMPRRLCALLFVRPAGAALLLLLLALLAPDAQAGYYGTVTYTGGTNSNTNPNDGPMAYGAWGAAVQGSYGYSGTASINGSGSCSGKITATYTWQHGTGQNDQNDPPPTAELVQETCDTGWQSGQSSPQPGFSFAGQYQNPISGPVTGDGVAKGGQLGVRYSVQGGGTITTSVTASASYMGSGAPPARGTQAASAHVSYTVLAVAPITVNLSGTNNPAAGDNRVLTGQQITATLAGIPANYTVTKYSWSGQSGTCFKTYNPNIQPPASNQLTPLASTDTSGPASGSTGSAPLVFYDRAAETLTLTCAVTVLAPDGTPLSFTATSPPINVLKPTATWGITSGYVRVNVFDLGLFHVPGDTVHMSGQSWHDIIISVPAPFSGGTFAFAQLIKPSVIIHRVLPQNSTATDNYQLPNNDVLGLDSVYPYDTDGVANGYSFPKPANTEIDGDSPSVEVPTFNGVTDNGGTSWDKSTASETFTTYLMYKSSSTNAVWVPLESYSWSWSGVWADVSDQHGGYTWTSEPGNPTAGSTPTATATNGPPTWSVVHTKSDFSNYVPGTP